MTKTKVVDLLNPLISTVVILCLLGLLIFAVSTEIIEQRNTNSINRLTTSDISEKCDNLSDDPIPSAVLECWSGGKLVI